MKDVVGRFSPIRPKLGFKGSLKRRMKDEGEETRGRIREVKINLNWFEVEACLRFSAWKHSRTLFSI